MSKYILLLACLFTILLIFFPLKTDASVYISADAIQSVGRKYYGRALGYITNSTGFALGYYYSSALENATVGSYIPLHSINKIKSMDIGFGVDLRSIFARSGGANKSSPPRYAYELLFNLHPISFLSIGTRYFWSTGGYFPKGLSLSVGLQTPN